MTRAELIKNTNATIEATREALQLVYDTLNQGQQKKLLKEESIVELFERYGVEY